jgi:hypothetical protein
VHEFPWLNLSGLEEFLAKAPSKTPSPPRRISEKQNFFLASLAVLGALARENKPR